MVDAHHHLWSLNTLNYPWLAEPGLESETAILGEYGPIRHDFGIMDLLAEFGPANVVRSVHIEAAAGRTESLAETAWLQGIADVHGFPHAIVISADLASPDAASTLERHLESANVRGVRQRKDLDRPGSAAFRAGLRLLRDHELSFELNTDSRGLAGWAELADLYPGNVFILGHAGQPWDRSQHGMAEWRRSLGLLAERPNFVAKISGLPMFDHSWTPATLEPIARQVVDLFGPDRCMFGTNWPVDALYGSYGELAAAYRMITSTFSSDEQSAMLSGNALRVYRI
jgi:predicted TIM-barrel fold metal-dependent hydrolase